MSLCHIMQQDDTMSGGVMQYEVAEFMPNWYEGAELANFLHPEYMYGFKEVTGHSPTYVCEHK